MAPTTSKSLLLTNYQQLKQAIEDEDEDLIHSTLEKLISTDKNNQHLKQLKIISQIQKGDFTKINENSLATLLQKIYSLYRLNKSEEALKLLEENKNKEQTTTTNELLYLEAQIHYRMGNYKKSSEIYEKILSIEFPSTNTSNNSNNIQNDELLTNLSASYTMNGNFQKGIQITKQCDYNTHELSYNASCGSIGLKDYEQSERFLQFAQQLCNQSSNQQQQSAEISSILVQLAYVKYLNGQIDQSKQLFEQVLENGGNTVLNTVAGAVAANNIVAIMDNNTKYGNVNTNNGNGTTHFDLEAQKKLKHAYQDKLQGKLTTEQIRGVTLNNCLLQLHLGKYEECEKIVNSELIHLFNNSENSTDSTGSSASDSEIPILILSHLYFKQHRYDQSIQLLKNYIKNNNNNNGSGNSGSSGSRVQLVLVQLYLQQGQYKECIQLLLKEPKLSSTKSIQSLLIALYMKIDDMSSALNILQQVINSKDSKDSNNNSEKIEMAKELASLQLQYKKYGEAAQTFEMLKQLDSKNVQLHTASLIEAMSFYDIDGAEKYCKDLNLSSTSGSSGDIKIDEIEKTSSIISSSSSSSGGSVKIDIQSIPTSHVSANTSAKTTNSGAGAGSSTRQVDALNRGEKKSQQQRKKRRNKLAIQPMMTVSGEAFKTRWESKKKPSANSGLMGFGHQGSSDVEAQKSVLHKKGQKTLLTPEQVLRSGGGAGSGASAAGASKKKKRK